MTDQPSPPKQRRRGAELEQALLEAALAELTEKGYDGLTIDAVAVRAGTSRTVVYRRWRTKPDIVQAALEHRRSSRPYTAPDTGSLRGDILALLRHANRSQTRTGDSVLAHLSSYYRDTGMSPADLRAAIVGADDQTFETIEQRAVARGELHAGTLTPRIRSLPFDLVRHELLMTLKPVPDELLVEIVDTIFLPLAARRGE